jgi:hypothetical protein
MLRITAILIFVAALAANQQARCEEFAQPPVWSDEVKNIFFDDARTALSGDPQTPSATDKPDQPASIESSPEKVWAALIDAETLMSVIRATHNQVGVAARNQSKFKAGVHLDCRRDMTLMGTLFRVLQKHPGEIRWKDSAPRLEQLCLHSAEACLQGTDESHAALTEALTQILEVFGGQPLSEGEVSEEQLTPEFAPLMQSMEQIVEITLPVYLGKQVEFRKSAAAAARKAAELAVLSQVIRGEEYGFADDETYQVHADSLRDAAQRLQKATLANEFNESVDAAAAIGNACAKCHADYRG